MTVPAPHQNSGLSPREPGDVAKSPQTIAELLVARAEQTPDAEAIQSPGRDPLTYEKLRLLTGQIGGKLRASGVREGERVALALPNGPESAVAFVAVSAFAACAPLNPAYQSKEFDFYLSDLDPAVLIIDPTACPGALEAAKKRSIEVLELKSNAAGPAGAFSLGGPEMVDNNFARPEDSALLLHTSGTTGRPKLVDLKQSQLIASAANIMTSLQLTVADRCLNVMPLFHIHGLVGSVLSTLAAGGSVFCAPVIDAEKFLFWLEEHRSTWYTAVPTIHQAILASVKAHPGAFDRHSLRFIRSCSASLPEAIARELEEVFCVPVIEAYGMTEATHQITSNPLPPERRKIGSVGLPTGTQLAVMAGDGFALVGQAGEIVIRGETIIESYANSDTSQDPTFTKGWLRTGDYGFVDEEGYVFLNGRIKEIINRGGEKISPLEVEEGLLSHPEIVQAAAFRLPHATLGEDVGAAVVLRPGSRVDEQSIRDYLLARVAAFKVPARIFLVEELPKGATGKLHRERLSERFGKMFPTRRSDEPINQIEATVLGIYREVLGSEMLGRGDNFFALGGDSVRATQVINRVRALLKVNLTIATIFHKPTVADLAAEIAANAVDSKSQTLIEPITQVARSR